MALLFCRYLFIFFFELFGLIVSSPLREGDALRGVRPTDVGPRAKGDEALAGAQQQHIQGDEGDEAL